MIIFLNGEFVPEAEAKVSVSDRSFLYGDGLFETMRVHNGKVFRWAHHWERLSLGAGALKMAIPFVSTALLSQAEELIQRNGMREGVLRLHLSRGVGTRGYSPRGADKPVLILTTHPVTNDFKVPPRWQLATSSHRLPIGSPLTQYKHANRLLHVLAKQEAQEQGADEAMLLNTAGEVVEAASANLFFIQANHICTPPLVSGALGGVTRSLVFELCRELDFDCQERSVFPEQLRECRGIFLTLSTLGIVEATHLDGFALPTSSLVKALQDVYREVLERETRS
ncbi:MAG TPA: aminodeoxychorismate lyase [Verrucomicrobiae bacterium]